MGWRIGIDVGGTNTDAVLVEGRQVLRWVKTPTTPEVGEGIQKAVREIIRDADPARIEAVMLGTTHFTNAVVERRHLTPVAVIRLAKPAGQSLPPMCDWPEDLRGKMEAGSYILPGGFEFDGRPLAPLDEERLWQIGRELREGGVAAAAISSVFAALDDSMEKRAAAILQEAHPQLLITLSSEIGGTGLLERENAAILNAGLMPLARRMLGHFEASLRQLQVEAPIYLTQNDGTVLHRDVAIRRPIMTFSSGPTNSMRGAAFLTGLHDGVVIDVGGTTTDVGVLRQGFPRPAGATVEVGGVRTHFRMPDVYSIGLGGGSYVSFQPPAVGPQSAGYRIREEAYCFGGRRWTATDVAVALGLAEVGEKNLIPLVKLQDLEAVRDWMVKKVALAVDRMKTSSDPVPAILVGGGSILLPEDLPGTSAVLRPDYFAVANAIGAAWAQIGGEVERVVRFEGKDRAQVWEELFAEAKEQAVAAGADPATVEIADREEVPLAYLPGQASRVRVKAVGDLRAKGEAL
ncbi:MAG: hydantoinase/oxoprolinase family protein [Bacillota bacterium]|nr:hydantoinase/oxoprolinase family protein [Bacillota bacterium]